ncbi:hypothetical protein Acr_00g0050920 [Actinidia rufa]|uniref:Uncharacterized protein n=1 Tax=Actinidia rufa TaxID=165716 RepID=A0A7J0DM94_9ERIC|nr:hypothetical protein Acr_00g0050920 [Actinidia rufa]
MRSHVPGEGATGQHTLGEGRTRGHTPRATLHAPARARGVGCTRARASRSEKEGTRQVAATRAPQVFDFDSFALLEVSRHSGFIRKEGHIKRDCPKYKAQDLSSDTAATAVMAVDESDVLLAASDNENFDANGGTLRVFKGNKEMLWGKKTRGLYRLEGSVQTWGATVRHGSSGISEENGQGKQLLHRGMQSKRRGTWRIRTSTWKIRNGTRAQGDALGYVRKSGQTRVVQPVQDVHREAQKKETKSILRSCTAKSVATPKRVSFTLDLISGGDLSSCAHKDGDMEPRQLAK